MRTKVAGINLILRPDGSLDGPSYVQSKAHFNSSVVWDALLESFVVLIFLKRLRLGDICDHLNQS
jgi:hypothetical protein